MYETTDDDYSNIQHRQEVQRVTKGPGYLKMSMNPELAALLRDWSTNHSTFWKSENPYSRKGFDNTESIAGCYANTHVSRWVGCDQAAAIPFRGAELGSLPAHP